MSVLNNFLLQRSPCHKLFHICTRSKHFTNKILPSIVPVFNANQKDKKLHYKYLLLFVSGYLTYRIFKEKHGLIPNVSAASLLNPPLLAGRRRQFNFIAEVVETSAPSVVYIEIKDSKRVEFFTGKPLTLSNGSGFIIKEDGLIVTNAHVVINKPSAKVDVRLFDGRVLQGVVEDVDLKSDLATVRIKANKLPIMKLGDSSDLKPGEFVVALGSPLALNNTVTCGVVSSTHRGSAELGMHDKDMVYIQTDAAITFGNSGGPLVNLDGEAIGVNSMKVTAGISFAIPINYVKAFLDATMKTPRRTDSSKRLYLGITMLTLTPQILHELHQRNQLVPADVQYGILVWKVIVGSPAHVGGLQPGDIVTHIDGYPVRSANDVYKILSGQKVKPIKLTVNRAGTKFEVVVVPEDVNE